MAEEDILACVLDIGSGFMKAGFGGDDAPRCTFKNIIGKPKPDAIGLLSGSSSNSSKKVYVGTAASQNSGMLNITYAVVNGVVNNFEALEYCLEHTFEVELRCDPSEYYTLITEAPNNPENNRNRMFETLFDKFDVLGAQCQIQAVLSLYASGRTTGMVFDSGDGVSHNVPVYRGYGMKNAVSSTQCAGNIVTKRVVDCLTSYDNIRLKNESNGLEIARSVKEKSCRIALDFESELATMMADQTNGCEYEFADGSRVFLARTRIEPPEVLFNPKNYGYQEATLSSLLSDSVAALNIDMRTDMFSNTVLSGGTTLFQGYTERFDKEYKDIVPSASVSKVKVAASPERYTSVFQGGSILTCLASFQNSWITRGEWAESGKDAIANKKLF